MKKIQGNDNTKLLDKTKSARLQAAEIYREFYKECIKKAQKSTFTEKECEPTYKLFYPMYEKKPANGQYISNSVIEGRIKSSIGNFKEAVRKFYEKANEENPRKKKLEFKKCSTGSELCLKIKNLEDDEKLIPDEQKIDNTTKSLYTTFDTDIYPENLTVHYTEEVLTSFNKIYLTFYQFLLALLFAFPAGVSMVILLGFFYQLLTDFSVIVKLRQIMLIIVPLSFTVLFAYLKSGLDFNRFESGKCVPSKVMRFLLYPLFKLPFINGGGYINIFEDNIVMQPSKDRKEVVISKYTAKCPVCKSKGKDSILKLKTKKGFIVAECERERLHTFIFDKETLKGSLVKLRDLIYINRII